MLRYIDSLARNFNGVATAAKVRRVGRLSRTGAGMAVSRVVHAVRKRVTPAERHEAMDVERRRKAAEGVVATLGELKGLAMKLGQQASYMQPGVGEEWGDALARLQQDAPPMGAAAARRVVERELGKPPAVLFAEWDPVPIAAASVGQVHRAVLHDGTKVAVKVQYPGAADALSADVDTVSLAARVFARRAALPDAGEGAVADGNAFRSVLDQFKARLIQETDYRREMANQELLRAAFAYDPLVHVPRVFPELSSARVLTMELAEGARFAEVLAWDQSERDRAGETLFRFHHECVFVVGSHNADPHPGNYLFRPGGHVVFLDFGALWEVPREFIDGASRLLDVLVAAGEVPPSLHWFGDQVVEEGRRAMPAPGRASEGAGPVSYGDDDAFVAAMAMATRENAFALGGVQAVVASLGAVADWGAIARAALARGAAKCA